jgi:hypothetical protein
MFRVVMEIGSFSARNWARLWRMAAILRRMTGLTDENAAVVGPPELSWA